MSKRVTTADFIAKARMIHGSKYNYPEVIYIAAKEKVTITCPIHGNFHQTPANHCSGRGCRACSGNKPLELKNFLKRARKAHNNKYDYSGVKFANVESKIDIICPEHGPYKQRLFSHLRGFGCPKCGWAQATEARSHDNDRFVNDATKAHGTKYDYSRVEYINALTPVTIVCPSHGPFKQNPASHIREVGCPKCGTERTASKKTRSTEDFINEAKEVHGDKYDYSKSVYTRSHDKLEITCPTHGPFWQSAVNHTRGNKSGCPGCAISGFDQTKPGMMYYLAVKADDEQILYKIGITNYSVEKRFPALDLSRIRIVKIWEYSEGKEAAYRENTILHQFSHFKYNGPDVLIGSGNTELFTRDVLNLDIKGEPSKHSMIDGQGNLSFLPTQIDLDI